MKKFLKLLIIITILFSVGYGAYHFYQKPITQGPVSRQTVTVMIAGEQPYHPSFSFVAKIESQDEANVLARVSGFLKKQLFTEGQTVQKDQVLFEIEKDQFEANVRRDEANLAKAEANLANEKAQYERAQKLYQTKDVSKARLDEREASFLTAEAVVKQARSDLEISKLNLSYTDIVAPISGKIGEKKYSVGSLIGPTSGPLAHIVSTNPMYAVFSISENQLMQLRGSINNGNTSQNFKTEFVFSDGQVYKEPGLINFVDVALDNQMNTLKLRATFPNPKNVLISGQYGRVVLTLNKTLSGIILPQAVIQRDLSGPFVYVVNKDNIIVQKRIVEGMELNNGGIVITSGIDNGDQILLDNYQKVPFLHDVPVIPVIQGAK